MASPTSSYSPIDHLYKNLGNRKFEDVTARTKPPAEKASSAVLPRARLRQRRLLDLYIGYFGD